MNRKEGKIVVKTLVEWILLLAFMVIIIGILGVTVLKLDMGVTKPTFKYFMNGLRSVSAKSYVGGALVPSMSLGMDDIGNVDIEGFSQALRETWYMYGRGKWDFNPKDSVETVYAFRLNETISLKQLFDYLQRHRKGKVLERKDYIKSDYNYLQKGSEGQTLCFGSEIYTLVHELDKDKTYYILFYDDSGAAEYGDKILIAKNPSIRKSAPFVCPTTDSVIIIKDLQDYMVKKNV